VDAVVVVLVVVVLCGWVSGCFWVDSPFLLFGVAQMCRESSRDLWSEVDSSRRGEKRKGVVQMVAILSIYLPPSLSLSLWQSQWVVGCLLVQ